MLSHPAAVAITTYNPVTISALENRTNVYFEARNTGQRTATLRFTSFEEIQRTRPEWLFHIFRVFGVGPRDSEFKLQPGESKTIDFYLSRDTGGRQQAQATLPFRFEVIETGEQGTIALTVDARDDGNPLRSLAERSVGTATIAGQAKSADGKPVAADVKVYLMTGEGSVLARASADGQYQLEVPWRRGLPPAADGGPHGPGHNALDMTPDGGRIVVGTRKYQVIVYDRDGTLLWSHEAMLRADFPNVPAYPGAISTAMSKDGQYIAAGYADSMIRIFQRER